MYQIRCAQMVETNQILTGIEILHMGNDKTNPDPDWLGVPAAKGDIKKEL